MSYSSDNAKALSNSDVSDAGVPVAAPGSLCHAMFVWQGFIDAASWTEKESDWYGGRIGAAREVAAAVVVLNLVLNAYLAARPEADFPGVLDYEVCEPLGAWCRRNPLASLNVLRLQVERQVRNFFEGTSPDPQSHEQPGQQELFSAERLLRREGFVVIAQGPGLYAEDVAATQPPLAWRLGP